ncbi:MAG: O-antigen ligase family protein [Syntrophomonadaceae bacterium]|nr:O-antigen ligase family protein [Syntrophomonadaceae bacterium]
MGVVFISPYFRGLYFEQELLPIIMVVALSFACCVGELLFKRDERFFNHPLDWAILALMVSYLLSIINAVHIHQALQALLTMALFFMVYFMAGRMIRNESDYNRLILIAYMMGIGLAIAGMGAAAGIINIPGAYADGHIRSTLQYHNTLAIYLTGLSLVGWGLTLRSERRISRLIYTGGNFLMVIVIIGAISRGTWILYPLGFMLFIFVINKQSRGYALFNWAIFFLFGVVSGFGFLNSINMGQKISALGFVLAGLMMTIFMQWLVESGKRKANRPDGKENFFIIGAPQLLGIWLVLMLGLFYMLLSNSGGITQIVPRQISAKVEKTSLQDYSVNDRLTFYQDAIKIARDYPLLGTGGGGWEALYHSYAERLYWSREVHSYYLQTLVEVGSLGLMALLAIVVLFLKLLINFKQQLGDGNLSHYALWGGAIAVIMIGMHSAIDFDFSLPSTGILFYALIGGIKGRIVNETRTNIKLINKKNRTEINKFTGVIPAVLGILIALIILVEAGAIYRASQLKEIGAQALEENKLEKASNFYQKAARLDPWQAVYQVNLAQIQALKADNDQNSQAHQEAKDYAARAAELEPYNSKVRNALINIYAMLREGDLRIAESEALVRANPLLEQSYEILAGNNMDAAWYFLQVGRKEQAEQYFIRVINIRQKLPAGAGQSGIGLNLLTGQAAVCQGNIKLGEELLSQVVNMNNEKAATARIWLAVASTLKGDNAAATSYLKQLSTQDKADIAKYQAIMQLLRSSNF